jgi:hypothetical protein
MVRVEDGVVVNRGAETLGIVVVWQAAQRREQSVAA